MHISNQGSQRTPVLFGNERLVIQKNALPLSNIIFVLSLALRNKTSILYSHCSFKVNTMIELPEKYNIDQAEGEVNFDFRG